MCNLSFSQAHHIFPFFVISFSSLLISFWLPICPSFITPKPLFSSSIPLPVPRSHNSLNLFSPHPVLPTTPLTKPLSSHPSVSSCYLFPHYVYYLSLFLLIPSLIFFFQSQFLSASSPDSFIPPSRHPTHFFLSTFCITPPTQSQQDFPFPFICMSFLSPSISLFHLSSPPCTPLLPLPRLAYLPSPLTVPSISPSLCPLSLSLPPSLCRNSTVTAAVFLIRGEEREWAAVRSSLLSHQSGLTEWEQISAGTKLICSRSAACSSTLELEMASLLPDPYPSACMCVHACVCVRGCGGRLLVRQLAVRQ